MSAENDEFEDVRNVWGAIKENKPEDVFRLAHFCDPSTPNEDGRTALMFAAALGRTACVEHLMRVTGGQHHLRDKSGFTAVHWAVIAGAERGFWSVSRTIPVRDKGEFFLSRAQSQQSCLDLVIDLGHGEVLASMLDGMLNPREVLDLLDISQLGPKPLSILLAMARHGYLERSVELVAKLHHRSRDETGRTPLHVAALLGSSTAVRALLAAGADPRALDSKARLPLHWCAVGFDGSQSVTRSEIARLLIPNCDPYWVDDSGASALMLALESGRSDLANDLLPHSDADLADFSGRDALSYAALSRFQPVDHAIWSKIRGSKHRIGSEMARQAKHDLQGRKFFAAVEEGDLSRMKRMLDAEDSRRAKSVREDGEDCMSTHSDTLPRIPLIHRIGADGHTALMVAARHGRVDCVELLLARGADPLARDLGNRTALMHAVTDARYLAEAGAECVPSLVPVSYLDARDNSNANALVRSLRCSTRRSFDRLVGGSRSDYLPPGELISMGVAANNDWGADAARKLFATTSQRELDASTPLASEKKKTLKDRTDIM